MVKTIVEQNNSFEDMLILKTEQHFSYLRPESISKINIHIKTGLVSIICVDKTEHVLNIEGVDSRLIDLFVKTGVLKLEDTNGNQSDRMDSSTEG